MKNSKWIYIAAGIVIILGVSIFAFIAMVILRLGHPYDPLQSRMWECTESLTRVLQKYSTEHDGTYPEHINDLISQKYLDTFPIYRYKPDESHMRSILLSDDGTWGEFTYIPVERDARIIGCYLIIYSDPKLFRRSKGYKGQDIDGDGKPENVLLVESLPEIPPPDFPALKDLVASYPGL